MQQDVKYMVTFDVGNTGNTGKELRERFSKRRHDVKNRPDNNELAAHKHKNQNEFDRDIVIHPPIKRLLPATGIEPIAFQNSVSKVAGLQLPLNM